MESSAAPRDEDGDTDMSEALKVCMVLDRGRRATCPGCRNPILHIPDSHNLRVRFPNGRYGHIGCLELPPNVQHLTFDEGLEQDEAQIQEIWELERASKDQETVEEVPQIEVSSMLEIADTCRSSLHFPERKGRW
ncbi:hypothetical protein H0H81_010596 [Sphagnurus paluster]|uniref:Uncharacterized protein n=1 Tax=Sphagnurus paluster TaxID=117069 RepID=A0A9P7FVK5_9AGAR|nr:hypothetical protein H0H81_010596 [Sphagnurus paluster]